MTQDQIKQDQGDNFLPALSSPVSLCKISQGAVASRIKQNVFNKRSKCSRLRHCLRLIGSEFHSRGPAAAKHRSPKMLDVRRVTQVAVSAHQVDER